MFERKYGTPYHWSESHQLCLIQLVEEHGLVEVLARTQQALKAQWLSGSIVTILTIERNWNSLSPARKESFDFLKQECTAS